MSFSDQIFKDQVNKWVQEIFKKEHFRKFSIKIAGQSEKGDGYVGDIAFVTVSAVTANGEDKEIHLVIKYGKTIEGIRDKLPVRMAFEREIFFYSKLLPALKDFEKEKGENFLESFVPKCYGTLLLDQQEVLFLGNLKTLGYEIHEIYKPMDVDHLKLTLENYGKWHALTLAYRDQKLEEYNALCPDFKCITSKFMQSLNGLLGKGEKAANRMLRDCNRSDLVEKLKQRFPNGFETHLLQVMGNQHVRYPVVLHGDCWNNNFMFKYQTGNQKKPTQVKFIDFQIVKLGSPALDLGYHLYTCSSKDQLSQFEDLLQHYYLTLSSSLKLLGSDPEKLLTYSDLKQQWKEYSSFGFIMSIMMLPLTLLSKEDSINIQDMDSDEAEQWYKKSRDIDDSILASRMIAVMEHFFKTT